jgi:hypothetical protein
MDFFDPYTITLTVCFLASLTVFYKPDPAHYYLKLFPPFLLLTILVELTAFYLQKRNQSNVLMYNFFSVFEFCYYLVIISLIISNVTVKRTIMIVIVLYTLTATGNILFIQKIKTFHTVTYALGCLTIVTFCVYYFYELFKLPKSVNLINNPAFWICSGLLFFYCCGFPLFALLNYWRGISSFVLNNFAQIISVLNVFLYSLFTIALLCTIVIRIRKPAV